MNNEELKTLIDQYGQHDLELKSMKEKCDNEKELLKNTMLALDEEGYMAKTSDFKVTLTKRVTDTPNEAKMLAVLDKYYEFSKENYFPDWGNPFAKMVRVLDTEALEKAIYNGELPADLLEKLDTCITHKTTYALTCAKIKK